MLRSTLCFCLLLVTASAAFGQVVPMTNDDCTSAIVIGDGVNPAAPAGLSGNVYTNAGSTPSAGSPVCSAATNLDVWFVYGATASGLLNVQTCTPAGFAAGTLADTVVTILDAALCPPTLTLACNDDSCGFRSSASTPVVAGGIYFIRVEGYNAAFGDFYITVFPPQQAPSNDECTSPVPLSLGPNGPFSNVAATTSAGAAASCGFGGSPGYRDIWFSYVPACSATVVVNSGCLGFDTILNAYAACGGAELACNDDTAGCGLSSSISFAGVGGTAYLIRASSYSTVNSGSFVLNVQQGAGMAVTFSSPFGPASLQINMTDGPSLGSYFLAVTFNAGTFPNGWLYGVDIPLTEIHNLLNLGAPFLAPLGPCGAATIGPFGGIGFLSGLPIYAVVLGMPSGSFTPSVHSPAVTYTIP